MSIEVDGLGLRGIARSPTPRSPTPQTGPEFGASLDWLLDVNNPEASPPSVESAAVGRPVALSRHAEGRLASRGLEFGPAEQAELQSALDELDGRGAKKALVVTGQQAWIVGVPRRTVITVMSRAEALGQVFTDLDATYLAS